MKFLSLSAVRGVVAVVMFDMNLIATLWNCCGDLQGGTGGTVAKLEWCLLQVVLSGGFAG